MKSIWIAVTLVFLLVTALFITLLQSDREIPLGSRNTVKSIRKRYGDAVYQRVQSDLQGAGFNSYPEKLCLIAIKEEQVLEVYGLLNKKWELIKCYPFTDYSGVLGPKLKQGDRQIPEGMYKINYLNPNSSLHLSAKISYPNTFDKKMAKRDKRTRLGGDIFIHGKAATVGCIPIGDKAIEELFIMLSYAMNRGVTIVITPVDFRKGKVAPIIPHISWEDTLYSLIKRELEKVPNQR